MRFKKGELVSRRSICFIEEANRDYYTVKNEEGLVWSISSKIAESEFEPASEYEEEIFLTPTKLAEEFFNISDGVFKVTFVKRNGENRILRGYKLKSNLFMGSTTVIDMEVEKGEGTHDTRIRTIRHDSLVEFTYKNKKYTLK